MQLNHQKSERKPHTRRGGKDNSPPGGPRRGNAGNSAKPTAATRYAVYDGTPFERIGSFRHDGNSFEAYSRRGQLLGSFATQKECLDAIDSAGAKS
jgi:hypothetical protein